MRRILFVPILALMAVFFVAAPANAATVDEFTLDGGAADFTAQVGDSVEYSITASSVGEFDLFADGDAADNPGVSGWSGNFGGGSGGDGFGFTGSVTFDEPGTYTFQVRAEEEGEADGFSDEITVTVEEADEVPPTEIPAPEITFPDECTVVLPETENVSYGVGTGQSGGEIDDTGDVNLADYYNLGEPVTFYAIADEGFTFPEDAQTAYEVTPSQDCFPQLVEAEAICQGVTFTNTTDDTLFVQYGDVTEENADETFELAAGADRTVSTDRDLVYYLSDREGDEQTAPDQQGFVEVEQDCTPASAGADHPTVAPAAGAGDASSAGATGALAVAALIGMGLLGARRLRAAA
ncbi:hypothetical protein ACHAAC_03885 [Aeromicrobium sp. CF4.19]|uniref:hypothetical protein n=1 Tax=Aeromicrobium sp. CF4.19 TaxID=3373082 RepID=UPI003EE80CC2